MTITGSEFPSWLGERRRPDHGNAALGLISRLSPSEGWATFALVAATMLIVSWSVTDAGWVETPGLAILMMIATVTGLTLAKVRAPAVLLHPVGLVVGLVLVAALASSLVEGGSFVEKSSVMWQRLGEWYAAATSGGISRDLLPFTMIMMTAGWLVAYLSSWFIFRSRNVWVPVLVTGTAILTNLSFLPGRYTYWFFIFTAFAMLLIVRMSVIQAQDRWQRQGVRFWVSGGWSTLGWAAALGLVTLVLSASMPEYSPVQRTLARAWKEARAPLAATEDHFARLFSGVPSKKDQPGRFFGDALPFQGPIAFGGEVVFWASSDYPSYWLSQTYSEYTSEGWLMGGAQTVEAGPEVLAPPRSNDVDRIPVEQTIQLGFSTDDFLSGGGLEWVSREAELSVLTPREFEVDVTSSEKDVELPKDIQALAANLRTRFEEGAGEEFIDSAVTRMLPDDLVLTAARYLQPEDEDDERSLKSVILTRKDPATPEVVSWRFTEEVPEEGAYFMTSYVSVASDNSLQMAGQEYGTHVTDHYLQLPASLPQRVRDLAVTVTGSADTPLDKANAVQDFLRSSEFTYAQDIEGPPIDADGVDHFLFETRTGYSDYFASSMAVMLRAAGVPSRMAGGYAPGEYDRESGLSLIRDSDSHVWVQVYFPEYGWIDFEPTPEWPVPTRELRPEQVGEGTGGGDITGGGVPLEDIDELLDIDDATTLQDSLGLPTATGSRFDPLRYIVPLAVISAAVIVVWLSGQLIWFLSLLRTPPVERPYAKMTRLGALAGVKRRLHVTPIEYAAAVAARNPKIAAAAGRIGGTFARSRYGGQQPGREEQNELETAWKSMRLSLAGRALGRLVPTWNRAV